MPSLIFGSKTYLESPIRTCRLSRSSNFASANFGPDSATTFFLNVRRISLNSFLFPQRKRDSSSAVRMVMSFWESLRTSWTFLVACPTLRPKSHKRYNVDSMICSTRGVSRYGSKNIKSTSEKGANSPLPYPPVQTTQIRSPDVGSAVGYIFLVVIVRANCKS